MFILNINVAVPLYKQLYDQILRTRAVGHTNCSRFVINRQILWSSHA